MDILNELLQFLIDEDNYWQDAITTLIDNGIIDLSKFNRHSKIPCRTRPFSGHHFITNMLSVHPKRGYDHFRMTNTMFIQLEQLLLSHDLICSTHNVTAKEQLAFFLYCIGQGVTNRVLAETFQHSREMISHHFNNVLKAICSLKQEYIIQLGEDIDMYTCV